MDILFDGNFASFVDLQTQFCVSLLQKHGWRAIELGSGICKAHQLIGPVLYTNKYNIGVLTLIIKINILNVYL